MTPADQSTLRLAIGLGIAVLVAYGLALPLPFAVCVMTVLMLSKPGPPMPLGKGAISALLLAITLAGGVLMVPVLENYALTGLMVTAGVLFVVFQGGLRRSNPLTMIFVMSFALIPVAGVAEQALAGQLSVTLATGVIVGTFVGGASHALMPYSLPPPGQARAAAGLDAETARWIALRAVLIVMPVFVLALANPSLYLAAVMKTVALGQQAGETNARSAGRELVGSTLMGALIGAAIWIGLSLLPNLWMLALWMTAAGLWTGSAMFGARPTTFRPSFWQNALITALILVGPAIEDSANGKSVLQASAVRTSVFVAVALYAWSTVWMLERWRRARSRAETPGEPMGDTT